MSVYQLTPHPSIAIPEISFAVWNDGFTTQELSDIDEICSQYVTKAATVGNDGRVVDDIRTSAIAWIPLTTKTQFLYDRIGYIARQLNGQFFDFDIWGFVEHLQYTVYNGEESHYTWHIDRAGGIGDAPRKLSLVLQLSDPSEYEGGDLEIFDGPEPIKIEKKKGMVTAFPSFVLHRVTPVTKGIRKTLVVWLTGPRFK
jgi:PKHD-type hydroxylase